MLYMYMTAKNKCRAIILFLFSVFYSAGLFSQSDTWYEAMTLARKIKAEVFYEALSQSCVFSKDGLTASVSAGSPLLILDKSKVEFYTAPKIEATKFLISADMATSIESFFSNRNETEPLFKVAAILIDPGHGGKDAGAVGEYYENGKKVTLYEKNVVLPIALDLVALLKATFPDKRILMTRSGDTYPTLEERADMANNIKVADDEAVIFISIHANAVFNKKAKGFEVWYLPRNYKRHNLANDKNIAQEIKPIVNSMLEEEFNLESILIAKNIEANLKETIGSYTISRGIKEKAYFVIRNSKMPSVLVEVGFVTNEAEAKLLNTPSYLNKCAVGIYNGIVQFISQFENYGF